MLNVTIQSTDNWGTAGNGLMTITNTGSDIENWSVKFTANNFTVSQFWNFDMTKESNTYNVTGLSWSSSLKAGAEINSAFAYNGSDVNLDVHIIEPVPSEPVPSEPVPSEPVPSEPVPSEPVPSEPVPSEPVPSEPVPREPVPSEPKTNKKLFGYYPEWGIYGRNFQPYHIPADKLTHVMYAFMVCNPSPEDFEILKNGYAFPLNPYYPDRPEGTLTTHDEFAALQKNQQGASGNIGSLKVLKENNPHLKIIISVGGWSLSWNLSKIAADPVKRNTFITSAVDFLITHGFDGIDIDWEFVGVMGPAYNHVDPESDGPNFIHLVKELRAEMDSKSPNKHLEITAATGTDPKVIANYLGSEPYLDYLLLMTYDYFGAFSDGGHHSGFHLNPNQPNPPEGFYTEAAIENALNIGYPAEKIAIGSPLYARGWSKLDTTTNEPIFGKNIGVPGNTYSGTNGQAGVTSWRHLKDELGQNGLEEFYDHVAQAPYAHNSQTGETWTYENPKSAQYKAQYVLNHNLAGMVFWDLSDDSRDGDRSILDAINVTLTPTEPVEPTPTEPVEPTPTEPVEPTPTEPVEPTPTEPVEPTPTEPVEPTPTENGLFLVNRTGKDIILKSGESLKLRIE